METHVKLFLIREFKVLFHKLDIVQIDISGFQLLFSEREHRANKGIVKLADRHFDNPSVSD
jgi:hypothetical protein